VRAAEGAELDVRLLGGFAVTVGGRPVPDAAWRQRRAAAVGKMLALAPGNSLHREQLSEALWPDYDPEAAAANLRVALHHARRQLEAAGATPGVILVRAGDAVSLGPAARVRVDVAAFEAAAERAWRSDDPAVAEEASALYRGELLPEDPYEDWAAVRREPLRAGYLALLAKLAELYEVRGELARAIVARERVLASEPADEPTHVALMPLRPPGCPPRARGRRRAGAGDAGAGRSDPGW
jgi:DNA-binding SARP family transcriptional activator